MAGVKGRTGTNPNSGGKQPGSGRKPLWRAQEIKEQLQKFLPDALVAIQTDIKTNGGHKGAYSAWKLFDKFVPDLKSTEIKNEEGKVFRVVEEYAKELPIEPVTDTIGSPDKHSD